ncbi:hypothetical protein [Chlorogloeopsis sp. ULAP02]
MPKIAIVGAGSGGLATVMRLAAQGYTRLKVDILNYLNSNLGLKLLLYS